MAGSKVSDSYAATSVEEQQAAYDKWAREYEQDLCAMGYRIPAVIASVFTRYVPMDAQPILDAGCGAGIQAEPLAMLGYGPIIGIDLSEGMIGVSRDKGIYSELRQMTLGERLDFDDDMFAAVISAGTITPKHAPAHSFDELIRVARPGSSIVFSLRSDAAQEPAYPQAVERLERDGLWVPVFSTDPFRSMPYGEPEVLHRVHVYQVA